MAHKWGVINRYVEVNSRWYISLKDYQIAKWSLEKWGQRQTIGWLQEGPFWVASSAYFQVSFRGKSKTFQRKRLNWIPLLGPNDSEGFFFPIWMGFSKIAGCGGFNDFLFSPQFWGEDSHFDEHVFQISWSHQPELKWPTWSSKSRRTVFPWIYPPPSMLARHHQIDSGDRESQLKPLFCHDIDCPMFSK